MSRGTLRRSAVAVRSAHGIVLLALLITLMLVGVLALAATEVWATAVQREREVELLFAGDQYLAAIRSYYYAAPRGQARVLPSSLDDLLNDQRSAVPVQHLRRLFRDPMSESEEWGFVQRGNGIAGVYSQSDRKPIKQSGFDAAHAAFEGKEAYRDWAFVFVPPAARRR